MSLSKAPSWLPLGLQVSPEVLALILDDGQAFRWHHQEDGSWLGFFLHYAARLRQDREGGLEFLAPKGREEDVAQALRHYFDFGRSYEAVIDALPWRGDAHLAHCLRAFPGLRILRQPFGETLLCFLCSSTKQIPQIKLMAEAMARELGTPLPEAPKLRTPTLSFHQLPTWEQLHRCDEAVLRRCGLGFRAAYVKGCAAFLARNPGWLEETEKVPYAEAHSRLMELPGVGAKIADCCLLYGAGKFEAFPTDTWILKAMAKRYGLESWAPDQVARFGRVHFGSGAGLAQQYVFNVERRYS